MKRLISFLLVILLFYIEMAAQVTSNTDVSDPDAPEMIDIQSNDKGMLKHHITPQIHEDTTT